MESRSLFVLVAGLCAALITPAYGANRGPEAEGASVSDRPCIVIHCGLKMLQVWMGLELVHEFPVEVGMGGLGKKAEGDHKTPIGDYEITWMASLAHPKGNRIVENRSWCKNNRFADASSGSSLERLWADCYGGDEAYVMSINYPNAHDAAAGRTGECIHIHADKRHEDGMLKKSYGCIHMYPVDAKRVYELVNVGCRVKLLP